MENLEFETIMLIIICSIVTTVIFWSIGMYIFKIPQILKVLEELNVKNKLSIQEVCNTERNEDVELKKSPMTESQRKVWDEIQKEK